MGVEPPKLTVQIAKTLERYPDGGQILKVRRRKVCIIIAMNKCAIVLSGTITGGLNVLLYASVGDAPLSCLK